MFSPTRETNPPFLSDTCCAFRRQVPGDDVWGNVTQLGPPPGEKDSLLSDGTIAGIVLGCLAAVVAFGERPTPCCTQAAGGADGGFGADVVDRISRPPSPRSFVPPAPKTLLDFVSLTWTWPICPPPQSPPENFGLCHFESGFQNCGTKLQPHQTTTTQNCLDFIILVGCLGFQNSGGRMHTLQVRTMA